MNREPPPVGVLRGLVALLVLMLGIGGAVVLVVTRKKPPTLVPAEPVLAVELQTAQATHTTVHVSSTGIASSIRTVRISPEVSGRILAMPRLLKAGDTVQAGEVLAQIDPKDYEWALAETKASVDALKAALSMIETGEKADRRQLAASRRSLELARGEFERLRSLRSQGQSVSQTVVDAAERTVQQAESQVIQLELSLEMVPQRRAETDSQLAAARARAERAAENLERCTISAPFTGRVVSVNMEEGERVQPGMHVLELADDRSLEIPVSVTASDLQQWISFDARGETASAWFPPLAPVEVEIEWTASNQSHIWKGTLDRVVSFDPGTRTATLAVRVEGKNLDAVTSGFPLTDGMFCSVRIPGKQLSGVFLLPRVAVTFDNQVYVSEDGRLKSVDVEVLDRRGEQVIVGTGLSDGDQVVLTRLVAPMEGAKLSRVEE